MTNTTQDAINEAAAQAHFDAYNAAIAAGKTKAEAMRIAEDARVDTVQAALSDARDAGVESAE